MTRFLGEFDVPVDQKGRIFIPAELRRKIVPEDGETLVVTRGLDGCLSVHPQHAWGEIADKMASRMFDSIIEECCRRLRK